MQKQGEMGHWSYLAIGKVRFGWKYEIPTFLAFLFQDSDLYIGPVHEGADTPDGEDEDLFPYYRCGYRTTVHAAKQALDDYGYTVEFFAGIYGSFRADLQNQLRDLLEEKFADDAPEDRTQDDVRRLVAERISASPDSALGDLLAFTEFLRKLIETDLQTTPFLEETQPTSSGLPRRVTVAGKYSAQDLAYYEDFDQLIRRHADELAANILRPAGLFDEFWRASHSEVVSLIYTRLMLDASSDDAMVELELSDIIETESELRSLRFDLERDLARKVEVDDRVFRVLSSREEHVQDHYARARVRTALSELSAAQTSQAKGEVLESLMEAIFSIKPQLEVVGRNSRTGDEEIDLILKNNVSRPFWTSLASPLLFVECKNWARPVGASELRNFEVKLQNHAHKTKIGMLVAPGGFTRDATEALKRASRSSCMMVLVTGEDLQALAEGETSVLDWLEGLLCRIT
jgi:hypothetical protein